MSHEDINYDSIPALQYIFHLLQVQMSIDKTQSYNSKVSARFRKTKTGQVKLNSYILILRKEHK
jgi:hypothetical protein